MSDVNIQQIQTIAAIIEQLAQVGLATAPKVKAVLMAFVVSDEELNARLDQNLAEIQRRREQALAEAKRAAEPAPTPMGTLTFK